MKAEQASPDFQMPLYLLRQTGLGQGNSSLYLQLPKTLIIPHVLISGLSWLQSKEMH
jgi:hypothetical protein